MATGLIAILVAAAAQAVDTSAVTGAQQQLHTPDVIAPEVLPYLACLYAARGLPLLRGSDGRQITFEKNGTDCSAARRRAESDALKALAGKRLPERVAPQAFVDRALGEMDRYAAPLPDQQNVGGERLVGLPITIEDEVQPAYDQYENCLKTQVQDTPISPDTLVAMFQQAISICRSVRDLAVTEAQDALVAKGWDAATRAQAAQSTFAKADEAWLVLARQFRDSLSARSAAKAANAKTRRDH